MKLIILAALTALCSAAKLDNTYLPPVAAKSAGGNEASLKTPLVISDELPAGSFVNEAQGVVVDAAAAGTRAASGSQESGLGGSRTSYGSTASKVGEAAFTDGIPNTFARIAPIPEHETIAGPVYGDKVFQSKTLLPPDSKDYNSNTLSYENNVESHKYNFGFKADNGIAVGENGVAKDGIHAQGEYSYKGNDGHNYKVTYNADKGGYQPQGSHLQQNAKEEAAGHYHDGSYDSQKYNAEGDYADTGKYDDKQGQFEKRPESQPNGVVINQNSQSGSIFSSGSESTAKPQILNDYKPGQQSTQTGHGQEISTGGTGAYGALGSSSFGQNTQGIHSGATSKPQFGQTSFGSQYTNNQFGSQFSHGSKPTFDSQPVTTQFGFNKESSPSFGGVSNTPSPQTFTQFGSQTGKQEVSGFVVPPASISTISGGKPGFPAQGTLFGKPVTSSFGSSTTNFGQADVSDVVNGAYLPPQSTPKPQDAQYQTPQFGVSPTPAVNSRVPAFSTGTPFFGSTAFPQESSASATASVFGSQPTFGGLSPQVLEGLKRPSTFSSGQYTSEGQTSSKPTFSSVQQTVSESTSTQETQEGTFSSGASFNKDAVSSSVTSGNKPTETGLLASKPGSKPAALATFSETSSTLTSQSEDFSSVEANKKPQLTGFQVSVQKPTLVQQSLEADQGYKYNQPAKPFGTPSIKPQGSTFPGVSSGQYNSASSTTNQGSGSYQPTFSGVTQAATSRFPSPSPTPVAAFPQKPFTQSSSTVFGQKPKIEKEQTQFGQESSVSTVDSDKTIVQSENTPSVPAQQYTGELYQYNKPEPVSPAVTPSSTPSSLNAFGQPTQSTFSQGSLTSSQFGQGSAYGKKPFGKPQFGFTQGSQTGSQFGVQKTQQVTQFGVKPQGFQTTQTAFGYKPFGSQFSTLGTKPQFGQTTQTQGSSLTQTQSTQQIVGTTTQQFSQTEPQKPLSGSVTEFQKQTTQSGVKPQGFQIPQIPIGYKPFGTQGSKPQFGQTTQTQGSSFTQTTQQLSQPQKPFGGSQLGISGTKPQFGQGSQVSETVSSLTEAQKQTTQFVAKPQGFQTTETQFGVKPVGTLFASQGSKPQLGQNTPTQGGSLTQTQITQQTFDTNIKQSGQQQKPFGGFQSSVSETKPQFGQVSQTTEDGSLLQSNKQTVVSVTETQKQTTQGNKIQTGYLPPAPLSITSTIGVPESKPQFGQETTQTTQQAVGSTVKDQTSQSQLGLQTQKPLSASSQFGIQSNKPGFGAGTQSSQGSKFQQSTQTSQQNVGSTSQGQTSQSQFGVQPQKPFGTVSQFGTQGSKVQFGQGTQFSQGNSFQQTSQQTVDSTTQGQSSQSQFGVKPQKPFGTVSQFGTQGSKPQFFQGSQTTQSQFGVQPQKPFGTVSQFGTQGSKLQFGQGTQFSQGSSFQQTTQQTVGSTTQGQTSQSQFGVKPQKPFGTTSQFGQGTQTSQGSTQQSFGSGIKGQTSQSQFGVKPQKPFETISQFGNQGSKPQFGQGTQTSQSQFGVQPQKPFGTVSQFGTQGSKLQLGQGTQTSQSSLQQFTQTTQQTVGSTTQGQTSHSQFGVQPQKPFGTTSQFGSQGLKPQFGQETQTSQGSSTQQTFGSGIKGQTTQSQFGVQPQKPFGTVSQFGSQGTKPQFGQGTQNSQGSSTQQTFGSGIKGQTVQSQFGVQPQKPFGTVSQFGSQGTKPQFGQGTQTSQGSSTQQTFGSGIKGQTTQSQFGIQPQKPFGTVTQFGTQGYKPFGQASQSTYGSTFQQSSQQTFGSATQGQTTQSKFESQTSKPFGSTFQFGTQGNKPQFGQAPQKAQGSYFQQTPVNSQIGSVSNVQSTQGSFTQFGTQTSKPFGTQFGVQETKSQVSQVSETTQGSSFTQSQTTQQTIGTSAQKQPTFGSQSQFGTQTYKPFGSQSQFSGQGSKPQFGQKPQTSQETSVTQSQISQTIQQTVGSTTTTQSKPGSQGLLGSQPLKPISITTQLGVQASKPQESSTTQTQTVEQSEGTVIQQESGQHSSTFDSQTSKPFGSTSQFGVIETKPQFGQVPQTSQGSSFTQTQPTQQIVGSIPITQQHQGSHTHFGSQSYKPTGSTQINSQGTKPQFGQVTQNTQQNTFTQSQFTQQSSYNKANEKKPFITSSPAPFTTAFGTQPAKTQLGSPAQNTQSSATTTGSTTSQFGQSASHGLTQFGSQSGKPFSTSHHQESKPQFGAPTKPEFGQSTHTYTPFTNSQHSQTQFGSQYKPFGSSPVSAFGKYQPKPQIGQTGYTGFPGFGTSQAFASASTSQQPFRGSLFNRPVGSSLTYPIKSQFSQPSFASAFASSSSGLPEYVPGTKFTVQPYGTPSTVLPTAQPGFSQSTTPTLGQEVSGTQSTSLTSVQGSEVNVPKPFSGGVKVPAVQPLSSKPNFGFSKPCCQSQFGQSTTQTAPSYQVSTTPSSLQSPSSQNPSDLHIVQGSGQKSEEFEGPKQPQRFDEKTGYYY